jgi:4,5-dihydroxyphthalate decarboxylase
VSGLRLTLACGDYDRTRALEEGSVRPDGIELTYLRLPVEETFFRMRGIIAVRQASVAAP